MLESAPVTRFLLGLRAQALSFGQLEGRRAACIAYSSFKTTQIDHSGRSRTCHTSSRHVTAISDSQHFRLRVVSTQWVGGVPCQTLRRNNGYSLVANVAQRRGYAQSPETDAQFGEMTEEQYRTSKERFQNLTARSIHTIFGPGMDAKQGNHLLNTVQKQRVTGTLDVNISGPGITKATVAKALTWLRKRYPLDEDAAIMARLDREEATINDWKPQQNADPANVWGESELDRVRAKNIEEHKKKEEAEKAEAKRLEEEAGETSGTLAVSPPRSFKELSRPRETRAWVERYRAKAALSEDEAPPNPSPARTLFIPGLFAAAVVVLCVAVAAEYEPPPRSARMFPEMPPAAATIGGLIAVNVFFWICWRLPFMWRTMNLNMLMIPATVNPVTLLGNIFSHQAFYHLAMNMTLLWFMGTALHEKVGRGRFLAIYIATGVLGSYTSLLRFVIMKNYTFTTLGASGALFGVIGAFCSLCPDTRISIAFLPEEWQKLFSLRADWCLAFLFVMELVNIARRSFSVDHVAHFGGLVSGMMGAEVLRRQARARRKRFVQPDPAPRAS